MASQLLSLDQVQFYRRPDINAFRVIVFEQMFLHVPKNGSRKDSTLFHCASRRSTNCQVRLVVHSDRGVLTGEHNHKSKHFTTLFHMKTLAFTSKLKISRDNLDQIVKHVQTLMPQNLNVAQECLDKISRFKIPDTPYQLISGAQFLAIIQLIEHNESVKHAKVSRRPGRPRKASEDAEHSIDTAHENSDPAATTHSKSFEISSSFSTLNATDNSNASSTASFHLPNFQYNINSIESAFANNYSQTFLPTLPPSFMQSLESNLGPSRANGLPLLIPLNAINSDSTDAFQAYSAYILLLPTQQ